jgi:hypothetical protein
MLIEYDKEDIMKLWISEEEKKMEYFLQNKSRSQVSIHFCVKMNVRN